LYKKKTPSSDYTTLIYVYNSHVDKHELIGMTIQQLIEHFKSSPESFEYYDRDTKSNNSVHPTIVFQPKIQLTDSATIIRDPNNNHAVIVVFHEMSSELLCYLFSKAPPNLSSLGVVVADCTISSKQYFIRWRSNYKKFNKLRDLILKRDSNREASEYLDKLSSVFPDSGDENIIGK